MFEIFDFIKSINYFLQVPIKPLLVSNRNYVESKNSGLSKLCLLVSLEVLERWKIWILTDRFSKDSFLTDRILRAFFF